MHFGVFFLCLSLARSIPSFIFRLNVQATKCSSMHGSQWTLHTHEQGNLTVSGVRMFILFVGQVSCANVLFMVIIGIFIWLLSLQRAIEWVFMLLSAALFSILIAIDHLNWGGKKEDREERIELMDRPQTEDDSRLNNKELSARSEKKPDRGRRI